MKFSLYRLGKEILVVTVEHEEMYRKDAVDSAANRRVMQFVNTLPDWVRPSLSLENYETKTLEGGSPLSVYTYRVKEGGRVPRKGRRFAWQNARSNHVSAA